MKQCAHFWLNYAIAICSSIAPVPVFAQIVPDATLDSNTSVITEGNTNVITGGSQAGSNLFHSFEQFSIPTNGTAYFKNAPEIQNIIIKA